MSCDGIRVRICVVYDCLYPWTVGGAERWMRALAEQLAAGGHDVTYLTRRQWPRDERPAVPGVRVIAVSREEPLYGPDGNRTIGEPLRFGRGVLGHLVRHRGDYDVVHTCSFPYFSLLAAGVALRGTPTRLGADWFEVWSRDYWREYLGGARGLVGAGVQRLCARVPQQAFVFSDLHARRLLDEGLRGTPVRLAGLYGGPLRAPRTPERERRPLVVFAGRHIAEKRVPAIPAAIAAVRERVPGLRALILGDGPQRHDVLAAIAEHGVEDCVDAPGFVEAAAVQAALRRATCLLLPSRREGYGLVVIEAAAAGTPSIVVAGSDNAAVELVHEGVNGTVAADGSPQALADAIAAIHAQGPELRARTAAWFKREAPRLTVAASARTVLETYGAPARR